MITPVVSGLIYSVNRRAVLEVLPPGLRKLWKDWDLRVAVLISLIIQILLTILGNRRKYNGKVWIRALVWSAYTAADSVTIFALGIISNKLSDVLDDKGNAGHLDPNMELTAVWAQFLYFHLGGPDSITAYALEDNELWTRQLLGLVSQTCGAIYVFLLAFTGRSVRLSILSILMFIAGFVKYGERIWTLKAASNQLHRKSVLNNLSIQHIGFRVLENVDADYDRDENKLLAAYGLLAATRRLFVNASLMPIQSVVMKMVFNKLSAENAFQLNEIQLGMVYDLLYSKGLLLFSTKGLPLRVITLLISCFSFVFFLAFIDHKHECSRIDLSITFALLIVAVILEIYAALALLSSDWFFVWLAKQGIKISKTLCSFPPFRMPRWSNSIGQHTLIRFFYKEKPLMSSCPFLGTERYNQWNTDQVDKDLRDLIFRYLKKKAGELQLMVKIREMPFTTLPTTTNQEEKLQEKEDQLPPHIIEEAEGQLNSTTEFEYKIVIWSIATEIMYYWDQNHFPEDLRRKCKAIKRIARYLLYLLVKHPSMISAQTDIMNPSFDDIIKANFFRRVDDHVSRTDICHQLLQLFDDKQHLTSVKEILLYKAMKIAKKKNVAQEPESLGKKWEEVGDFWSEMLAYSANRCTVNNHAQRLRYGGEFLTHVWLLMAHFGLTQHHFQRTWRWPNNVGQYTLLRFLSKEKPLLSWGPFSRTEKYNEWNSQVDELLRDLICWYFKEKADELQSKVKNREMPFTILPTTTDQEEKLRQEEDQLLPGIIEQAEGQLNSKTEFEYKIVIWSIATEIMYYLDQNDISEDFLPKCKAIKRIARYMLYLLVKHPSMISAHTGIMNPSFDDIIKANFFRRVDDYISRLSRTEICHMLLECFHDKQHFTSMEEIVIYKAMKIVAKKKAAQEIESLRKKWKEVGDFWLEMLAYSANRCTVNNHAQKLRYGGEFLTHVWLLMSHFGLAHHRFQSLTIEGLKFITTTNDKGNDWKAVEKRFEDITKHTNGLLHHSMFGTCIGMDAQSKEFSNELFWAIARKHKINDDSINKEQFHQFWDQISDENFDTRLKTFIDMVDKDADGKITKHDIQEIISLSASANKLSHFQPRAEEYAALIMEELDPCGDGCITVQKLETLLIEKVLREELKPKEDPLLRTEHMRTEEKNPLRRWYQKVKYFLINHWQNLWVLMLWLGIVSGLFAYKFVQYRNKAVYIVMGNCVCIAKGAAETLKFNMALILLPVCRNTITWLRNKTKSGIVVPFDNNLDFHMVIGAGVAIGVILHGGAHLICDFPRLIHATEQEYEPMKPYFGEKQPQNYWWFLKGVEGVTGIIMVVLMAIAFTLANPWFRRNKFKNMPEALKKLTGFNAFWYSHHLFAIVYVLLVVHGIYLYLTKTWYQKTTWMYLTVPVLLYSCERLIRAFRSIIKTVDIIKASVYPEVLALYMSKPEDFEYESGQYMFVNCPAVSPFEWHPFFITSAPGDDYLSVHIRALGDWTKQLKNVFSKVTQPASTGKSESNSGDDGSKTSIPEIKIDGPYGAPAQDYKTYDVVLLIGLGIGATPMISIVKDIINNMQTQESALENGNYKATSSTFRTKKAYFYWVTSNQRSFEWFKEVMNEVAETDERGVIELHTYCSSVYEKGDARSALISMLQSLNHAKNGVDVVSGSRVKSHFAKPNWRQVYENIASLHANTKIGVFYCGTPVAIKELRQLALEVSENTSTEFEFHKENFLARTL